MYLTIFITGLLGCISPGPDFFIVIKNSIIHGRKVGLSTALGISIALSVHVTYTILGFVLILQRHQLLFYLIQISGAIYLIWLGYGAIRSKKSELELSFNKDNTALKTELMGFKNGFLCNILNPKVAVFFLSIFSQFINSKTPSYTQWIYGSEIVIAGLLWFSILSVIISYKKFKFFYQNYRQWFDRLLGLVLVVIALKIIFTIIYEFIK